jgi:hypothetical protein
LGFKFSTKIAELDIFKDEDFTHKSIRDNMVRS